MSTIWRADRPEALTFQNWDGEAEGVVFDAASGDLHLLNASAIHVLEYLTTHALSVEGLHAQFPDLSQDALASLMSTFDDLGLVSPADS